MYISAWFLVFGIRDVKWYVYLIEWSLSPFVVYGLEMCMINYSFYQLCVGVDTAPNTDFGGADCPPSLGPDARK